MPPRVSNPDQAEADRPLRPADVIVTERLAARTGRQPDYAAENRALHALARVLGDSPEAALETLVREALALCVPGGNGTAGVSLLEGEEDAAHFRWTAMAGKLASAAGGTSPRDCSPCGVCLDEGEPVLFARPDLCFACIPEMGQPMVENLVLPFFVNGQAAGTIWVVTHDDAHQFDAEDVRVMTSLASVTGAAYAAIRARQALGRVADERELALAAEQSARVEAEQANRSKTDFLALMSHELRTPLNAIGGYAELLEMGLRGPVSDLQRQDLARIQQSQRHLLGLINQVLNYARVEAATVNYDIREVVVAQALAMAEALVVPQARARGLTLRAETCGPDVRVRADADKLQQIILNLLSNAVKFTERGGTIFLRCETRDAQVAIRVTDSGIGIPAEKLASVFEPFVQVDQSLRRRHEGVGLGLAISRELARGMGGDLDARSVFGEGSTFRLTLPRA